MSSTSLFWGSRTPLWSTGRNWVYGDQVINGVFAWFWGTIVFPHPNDIRPGDRPDIRDQKGQSWHIVLLPCGKTTHPSSIEGRLTLVNAMWALVTCHFWAEGLRQCVVCHLSFSSGNIQIGPTVSLGTQTKMAWSRAEVTLRWTYNMRKKFFHCKPLTFGPFVTSV